MLIFQLRGFLQQQSAKLFQGCNDRLITTLELCLLHRFGAALLRSQSPGAAKAGAAFLLALDPFPPGDAVKPAPPLLVLGVDTEGHVGEL